MAEIVGCQDELGGDHNIIVGKVMRADGARRSFPATCTIIALKYSDQYLYSIGHNTLIKLLPRLEFK